MKKRILAIVFSCIAITFVYFCLDINNVIAGMGIPTYEINWDIAPIVISNLVVIGLYLITFSLLDHRSVEKDGNQREVALLLLNKTYEQCKESVVLFERPEVLAKAVEKCDFSKVIYEDPQMMYYLEFPFEIHKQIVEFACSGVISQKEFSDYIDVREAFKNHITVKIMFFDNDNLANEGKVKFNAILNKAKCALNRGEHNARL